MALVEEGKDFVADLEARGFFSHCFDCAGAIGGGNDTVAEGEGVLALEGLC